MKHWAEQYLGLPWQSGAQGPQAFDCWALVRHVHRAHFGRELPVVDVDAANLAAVRATFAATPIFQLWRQVEQPAEGDAVVMHKGSAADHVGVWVEVDGGRVLHAAQGAGVVATPLAALRRLGWGRVSFWRYHGVGGAA